MKEENALRSRVCKTNDIIQVSILGIGLLLATLLSDRSSFLSILSFPFYVRYIYLLSKKYLLALDLQILDENMNTFLHDVCN